MEELDHKVRAYYHLTGEDESASREPGDKAAGAKETQKKDSGKKEEDKKAAAQSELALKGGKKE